MTTSIVIALVGLIVVIMGHTVVIARWSGKIDGYLEAAQRNFTRQDGEIMKLREAKHELLGKCQLHDGQIRGLETRMRRLDHESADD